MPTCPRDTEIQNTCGVLERRNSCKTMAFACVGIHKMSSPEVFIINSIPEQRTELANRKRVYCTTTMGLSDLGPSKRKYNSIISPLSFNDSVSKEL